MIGGRVTFWWQGRWAMWTPQAHHAFEDTQLERIGHSGVPLDTGERAE